MAEKSCEGLEAEVERLRVRLAKVEALADEWEALRGPASWPKHAAKVIRAALADAPTEQRAGA